MKFHILKTIQPYYDAVKCNEKTFEVRKNDRDYQVGDVLILYKFPVEKDTYEVIVRRVTIILHGGQFGIEEGHCIMSLGSTYSFKSIDFKAGQEFAMFMKNENTDGINLDLSKKG